MTYRCPYLTKSESYNCGEYFMVNCGYLWWLYDVDDVNYLGYNFNLIFNV